MIGSLSNGAITSSSLGFSVAMIEGQYRIESWWLEEILDQARVKRKRALQSLISTERQTDSWTVDAWMH